MQGLQEGFNAGNAFVNAIRARKDNERIRRNQEELGEMAKKILQRNNPNAPAVSQEDAALGQQLYSQYRDQNRNVPDAWGQILGDQPAQTGQEQQQQAAQLPSFSYGQQQQDVYRPVQQPQQQAPQLPSFTYGQQYEGGFSPTGQTKTMGAQQTPTFTSLLNGLKAQNQNEQNNQNNQLPQGILPFGVSAGDEGQRAVEEGSFSPVIGQQLGLTVPQESNLPAYEKALDGRFSRQNFMQEAMDEGMSPVNALLVYSSFAAPLENAARQERIRHNIGVWENPNSTNEQKLNARIQLATDLGQLDLGFDLNQKRIAADLAKDKLLIDAGYMPEWMESAIGGGDYRNNDIYNNNQGVDYSGESLEGKSWIRNNDGVDLSNAKPNTLAGLNHISDIFQKMTGKQLIVTSGNDGNIHAGGEFSHGNGWKVDVSGNGLDDDKTRHEFIKQCENLGIKVLDEYENPSPNSTGGHLDLEFSGYKIPQTKTTSRGRALKLTPKELARQEKERRAELREARRDAREEARLKLDAWKAQQRYGEGGSGTGSIGGLIDKKGNLIAPYEVDMNVENLLSDMEDYLIKQEGDGKSPEEIKPSREIGMNIIGTLNPVYKYLVKNGMSESQAKSILKSYLQGKYKDLDKNAKGRFKIKHINDIINSLSTNSSDDSAPSDENLEVLNTSNPEVDRRQEMEKKTIAAAQNQAYNQAYERARRGEVSIRGDSIGSFQHNAILPEAYNSREEGEQARENSRTAKAYAEAEKNKINSYEAARAYLDKNNVDMNRIIESDADRVSLYDALREQLDNVRSKVRSNEPFFTGRIF